MKKPNSITVFHGNAPKKLIKLYRKQGGSCSKTAETIGVNPSHVWQLLKNGHEPKREDLRKKLFLSHKKTPEELEKLRKEKQRKTDLLNEEIDKHFKHIMEVYNGR
jgi:transposase-like protein